MNGQLLIGSGLLFGLMMGALLLLRASMERNRLAAAAAALLLIGAVTGGVIVASWQMPEGAAAVAELVELALMLAAGPISLILLGFLLRVRLSARLPVAIAAAAFVALALMEVRLGGDPVRYAVPLHAGFTLWGWWLFAGALRARGWAARRSKARRQQVLALWLLIALSIAHLASLTRLVFPAVEALRAIVPWTLSLLFAALLVAIIWIFLARYAAALDAPPDSESEEVRLAAAAAGIIARERLFRDQNLKLEAVAVRLGVAPATLAAALAASEHGSFAALLHSVRLEQARLMLSDPSEGATSIEAIGMLCGFRSRSTFYEGFQRRSGMSPGAYRARSNLSES